MSFKNKSEENWQVHCNHSLTQKIISKQIISNSIMKKNNRGFSLVELMIVVGMLGGLGLGVMNITKQSNKSSTKFQFDSDVTLTTNEINGILSNPAKCLTTLGSTATPTNIVGKYYTSTVPPGDQGYGNSRLKVASYTLTGTAPNGVLTIAYENKNILKGSTGSPTVPKKINMYIEGAPGAITMCRSLSTSTTDIWSHGTGTDINYAGNVGIGTTSPATQLEVNGGLALKTATAKPTCNSSTRGTFWFTQAGAGVKDSIEACSKDAADAYAWSTLGAGGIGGNTTTITGVNPACPIGQTLVLKYWVSVSSPGMACGPCSTGIGPSLSAPTCVYKTMDNACNNSHTLTASTWNIVICKTN